MRLLKKISFVLIITWLTLKLNIYFLFSSDKEIGALIRKYNSIDQKKEYSYYNYKKVNRINKYIDLVINYLPLRKTCLIRSLVKKEYLEINNIFVNIFIGVKREDEKIMAHAWIDQASTSLEKFKVLYKI